MKKLVPSPWLVFVLLSCAGPERAPALVRERQRAGDEARLAFQNGDLPRARTLYARAVELARLTDDAEELGNRAFDLAIVLAESGDPTAAEVLLRESEAALRRAGRATHDVSLLRARLGLARGDVAAAEAALAEPAVQQPSARDPATSCEVALVRGEIARHRGDPAALRTALAAARTASEGAAVPDLDLLEGSLAELESRPGEAALAFDRAAAGLRAAREYRRMAHALSRAGAAHARVGAPALAADRWLRAGHSHLAAGDRVGAERCARLALAAADQCGDADLRARAEALQRASQRS